MLQHVEGEDGVKSALLSCGCQIFLSMEKFDVEIALPGALAGKSHGFALYVVVDGPVSPGDLQQKLAVACPVVEARVVRALEHIQVGADALVLKVVTGEREQIQL